MTKHQLPAPHVFPGLELDKHQQESLRWGRERASDPPVISPLFTDPWGILYYGFGYENSPLQDKK